MVYVLVVFIIFVSVIQTNTNWSSIWREILKGNEMRKNYYNVLKHLRIDKLP